MVPLVIHIIIEVALNDDLLIIKMIEIISIRRSLLVTLGTLVSLSSLDHVLVHLIILEMIEPVS